MNPLEQYPEIRRVLYFVQWVVNLVLGVLMVVLVALGQSPVWFVIVTGAFNFIWSYTGLTAGANVTPKPDAPVVTNVVVNAPGSPEETAQAVTDHITGTLDDDPAVRRTLE